MIVYIQAISGKAPTRPTNSTFNLPGRAIPSNSACRLHYKDQCPEMKLFEAIGESCGGRALDEKDIASSDSNLRETCEHARKVPISSSQHYTSNIPCSDADIYFQDVMAALCTDRHTSNKLSRSCFTEKVNLAQAAKRIEGKSKATRSANVKSCGDYHAFHQFDGIENSMKTNVHQSRSKHIIEKQHFLSNVQKLQNVAETAKRLYTDLVDCTYDELRASTSCKNLDKHQDGNGARDISKFSKSQFCPSREIISAHRTTIGNNEVCGRCYLCQPQFGK